MASNIVQLPRPSGARIALRPLGLYFRVGRDQHKDVLDLLAEGEHGFHGLVIDAAYSHRHRDRYGRATANPRGARDRPRTTMKRKGETAVSLRIEERP